MTFVYLSSTILFRSYIYQNAPAPCGDVDNASGMCTVSLTRFMKTKLTAIVAAMFVAILGCVPSAIAQGNVTPLSSGQFSNMLNQSAWVLQIGGSGNSMWLDPGIMHTNGVGLDLFQSFKVSFFLTQSNGTVTATAQIMNGIGVSLDPISTSLGSSLAPISGLAFFMVTNSSAQGSMNNVYVNDVYLPTAINAPDISNGTLVSFGHNTSFFASAFDIDNQSVGNHNDYYVLGVTVVPEPNTLMLGVAGCLVLWGIILWGIRRKK